MATRRNIAYSPPAGTVLFLQIFYLDNMDYGQISLPKGAEPRIELYDARTLSKHIPADTIGLRGQTPCRMFGNVKARADNDVVYRRGVIQRAHKQQTSPKKIEQQKRPRPENALARKPPTQYEEEKETHKELDPRTKMILAAKAHRARCLKILTLARKSIEEEADKLLETFTAPSGQPSTPSPTLQDRRGETSTTSPVSQHHLRMQAFGTPSFSLGKEFDEVAITGPTQSPRTPISPIVPSPPRKTLRRSNPTSPLSSTKMKSGEFLFNKRSSEKINLNDDALELEFTQSPVTKKTVQEGRIIVPPRDTSLIANRPKRAAANAFYKWVMQSKGDADRFWIRHVSPKFIEISSQQIIQQFGPNGALEPDTCDALLRQFQQTGPSGVPRDWRHYLETDFPMRVIVGEDYISSRSIQHQWIGKHIKNETSRNACCSYDMKRRQLTIHAAGNKSGEWDSYDKIITLLNSAFKRCTETFFEVNSVDKPPYQIAGKIILITPPDQNIFEGMITGQNHYGSAERSTASSKAGNSHCQHQNVLHMRSSFSSPQP